MKAELYKNCSLVRLSIKAGVADYYLPQNVDWAAKKVDKLLIVAPDNNLSVDPVDGKTPVLSYSTLESLDGYITLYDADNRELMHDVSVKQLSHYNNNPLYVNAELNLSLCRISFMTAPVADATLLLYAFYETRTEDYFDMPRKSVTAVFDLAANQELSFQEIINTYVHALPAKIKGIVWWDNSNPAYLTLRDYDLTYQMASVHSELCRPDMNGGSAMRSQGQLFFVDDIDVDFDYSNIREAAGQVSTQKITFLY